MINDKDIIELIKGGKSYLQKNDMNGFFSYVPSWYRTAVIEFFLNRTSIPIFNYMTEIPDRFLEESRNIKQIMIPGNVKKIGRNAFDSSSLVQVDMEPGVELLGSECFYNCKDLEVINLSDTIKAIPNLAFAGCTNLKKIFLPDSIQIIGSEAFTGCEDVEIVANYRQADKIRAKKADYEFLKKHLKFTH